MATLVGYQDRAMAQVECNAPLSRVVPLIERHAAPEFDTDAPDAAALAVAEEQRARAARAGKRAELERFHQDLRRRVTLAARKKRLDDLNEPAPSPPSAAKAAHVPPPPPPPAMRMEEAPTQPTDVEPTTFVEEPPMMPLSALAIKVEQVLQEAMNARRCMLSLKLPAAASA